jgi:transmembrane sensor
MSDAEKIEAVAAEYLARRDNPAWTEESQQALDIWLAESTAHRVAYLRLSHVWQRADRLSVLRSPEPQVNQKTTVAGLPHFPTQRVAAGLRLLHVWQRADRPSTPRSPEPQAKQKITAARAPHSSMQRVAAGMVVAVALGAGWFGWHGLNEDAGPNVHYSTAVGARESVALADGSHLILNTNTRLRAEVGKAGRMVWLERGEAFFEVAHDSSRPFVVLAGDRRITVLGTRFSVHRRGDEVDVVVEEGRVQVAPQLAQANVKPMVVTRNQKVVSEGGNVLVVLKPAAQIVNELSWRQGKLVFDQMTLAEAAAEFNRYNVKKIVIADPAVAAMRIGGSFDTGNVVGFTKLLQQGFALAVNDNGTEIKISK